MTASSLPDCGVSSFLLNVNVTILMLWPEETAVWRNLSTHDRALWKKHSLQAEWPRGLWLQLLSLTLDFRTQFWTKVIVSKFKMISAELSQTCASENKDWKITFNQTVLFKICLFSSFKVLVTENKREVKDGLKRNVKWVNRDDSDLDKCLHELKFGWF